MVDLKATLSSALDGRYAIEGEVGRGGMSVVFRAQDLKHQRTVAIKVLKPELSERVGADRFHREVEFAAGLSNPHILPLYDSGVAAGLLYYVMPCIKGGTLKDRLKEVGSLDVEEAIAIARSVASALEAAHKHGIVHRDIKPANILFWGGEAVVADFGIAQAIGPEDEVRLTQTGLSVGSPAFMSPEQASGDQVDARSDIYSLGCVLYAMLTGEPPFIRPTTRATLVAQMTEAPPSARDVRPELPKRVDEIVLTTLQKSPEDRFASAAALIDALDHPELKPRHRILRRLGADGPRRRLLRFGLTVAAVLVLAILIPLLLDLLAPDAPAYFVEDPRGSYVILPSARAGQTPAEEALVVDLADWFAWRLGSFDRVRVVQEMDMTGPRGDLGLEGPTMTRLEDGIRLAQALRVGTLVTITLRIVGDSAYTEARQYDVADGYELDAVQSEALRGEMDALATPFVFTILEYRGEVTDPGQLAELTRNPLALQEFQAGRKALNDWRLQEAELKFREAISQDPTFALPHHYLALTLYWQTTRRADLTSEIGAEAARLTERAVRLASESDLQAGQVASINAFAAFWAADYESARRQYDEILGADSTDSEAWLLRGAVEFEDPRAEIDVDGLLKPRQNLNVAKRAFETSVRLARDRQLSYGLLFDIDRQVLDATSRRGCPLFQRPGEPLLPPWQIAEATDQPAFCPIMADSLIWIPDDELTASALDEAQLGATRLYRETLRNIQMWADFAPDQPRPREEWSAWLLERRKGLGCDADPSLIADITQQALENKQIQLAIAGDTTPGDRVRLANLLWATGRTAAAEAQLDRAVHGADSSLSESGRDLPPEAANLYLATGRPSQAMAVIAATQPSQNLSFEDPRDGSVVSSGEVEPTLSALRVLGSVGKGGGQITAAFEELERRWSDMDFTDRDRAVLHQGFLPWLGPALLLDTKMQRVWLGDLDEHQIEAPLEWLGLLAAEEDSLAAVRYLEQVTDSLLASQFPRTSKLYLAGVLAQRVGQHAMAVEHFERLEECPLSLGSVGFGWGLQALSRLQRARSLEALGRSRESAAAYRSLTEAWSTPDPELENTVAAARAAADRLEP